MQVTSLPQKQGETCSLQSGTNLEQKRSLPSHFLSVLARSQPTIHFLQGDNDRSLTFVLSPLSCRGSFSSLFSFRQIADSVPACSFLLKSACTMELHQKPTFPKKERRNQTAEWRAKKASLARKVQPVLLLAPDICYSPCSEKSGFTYRFFQLTGRRCWEKETQLHSAFVVCAPSKKFLPVWPRFLLGPSAFCIHGFAHPCTQRDMQTPSETWSALAWLHAQDQFLSKDSPSHLLKEKGSLMHDFNFHMKPQRVGRAIFWEALSMLFQGKSPIVYSSSNALPSPAENRHGLIYGTALDFGTHSTKVREY